MPIHAHFIRRDILTSKVRHTDLVFTARRYASAVLAVIVYLSVRLSVCHKSELYKDGYT